MDGGIGCPPTGLGVKGAGSEIARGGEPAHDATVTMSPFWKCPHRWHHDFGGWRLAFASRRAHISVFDWGGGITGRAFFHFVVVCVFLVPVSGGGGGGTECGGHLL